MHCTREIAPHIYWVGGNDRRLELFENMFPLPNGVAYNSYLIIDEKVALLDTVDSSITRQFFENLEYVLAGRDIDYLVINHMEPDHCANIEELCRRFPNMKIVGNQKSFQMIRQYYDFELETNTYEVKEKDIINLGSHRLSFYFAPMVHWPEVMFTYEEQENILFTADAFGSFGAFSGNLFSDEMDFDDVYLNESRRYYTNIVGRYGAQVQSVLKKLSDVEIRMICPLHGPVWRKNIDFILKNYDLWSRYAPEKNGVVLIYASMYGNTENAVNIIASYLAEKGVKDLRIYDVSKTHASYIIADAFQYSHLVFAAPTYNNGLYFGMEALLKDMAVLNLQNRKVAVIGNGSWAPAAHTVMEALLCEMKNMELLAPPFVMRSSLKCSQIDELLAIADAVCSSVMKITESIETGGRDMYLEHTAIYTNDLERLKEFYAKYFSGRANEKYYNPKTGLQSYFISFGSGARLELMQKPELEANGGNPLRKGLTHLAFCAGSRDKVDELTQRLVKDGYVMKSAPRETGDGYYESCIFDPDSNEVEITA